MFGGFFLEQFGLPLEECAPYYASTFYSKCYDYKDCKKAIKVEKTYYVGGYFGNSSELEMMKEIRSRGPIVGELEVPMSFFYYSSGIFTDDKAQALVTAKVEESFDNPINKMTI